MMDSDSYWDEIEREAGRKVHPNIRAGGTGCFWCGREQIHEDSIAYFPRGFEYWCEEKEGKCLRVTRLTISRRIDLFICKFFGHRIESHGMFCERCLCRSDVWKERIKQEQMKEEQEQT